jgi:hypothetical protein
VKKTSYDRAEQRFINAYDWMSDELTKAVGPKSADNMTRNTLRRAIDVFAEAYAWKQVVLILGANVSAIERQAPSLNTGVSDDDGDSRESRMCSIESRLAEQGSALTKEIEQRIGCRLSQCY